MNKKEVFKRIIVESQSLKPHLINRELKLPLETQKVVSLYGPRRSGKTYLFYQTMRDLVEKGTPQERILYVNFEDERILPFGKEDWETLMEAFFELYPENMGQKLYLFFDEVQAAPFWDKFIRRVSEKKDFSIFLTGSSSKLLSREISTSLRGRTITFFLTPFSFSEVLSAKGLKIQPNVEYSQSRHRLKKEFSEYLKFGGFPEILDKEEQLKIRILQEYFEMIFYRDIVERHKIRNYTLMKNLMRYLTGNFGSLFSVMGYYNLLKSSGQKIGKDTLCEYVSWLEDINFVKLVPFFDYSPKRRMVNPRKAYCIDTGLITAVASQFSENKGRYLENVVYLELLRRGKDVYYWKDPSFGEVDFLIAEGGKPKQLIQVSADVDEKRVMEREKTPLLSAAKIFGINDCLILTEDRKTKLSAGRLTVKISPVWLWLLKK